MARAALAEALTGNMSTHVLYCVREGEMPPVPDGSAPDAVPIAREMPGAELAKLIQRDGTIVFNFDGLRVPLPLPAQAAAILPLIDGRRSVAAIGAALAERGIDRAAFARAWAATYAALVAVNRVLLAPPR